MKEKMQERFELLVLVSIFCTSLLGVNPSV